MRFKANNVVHYQTEIFSLCIGSVHEGRFHGVSKTVPCDDIRTEMGKTTESVHCTITGPCRCMRHRPSLRPVYRSCNHAPKWSNY